jgi:myo-inositol-1(or 4)-monophosphatase
MKDPSAAQLLELAVTVAREAAELARGRRRVGIGPVTTKSTATDPVTATDRAVERLIVTRLREARGHDTFLGEEYGAALGEPSFDGPQASAGEAAGRVRWVVDPIDGTVNFMYGIPQYAISIAAEVDGVVVAGVVRNAATGDEYTAVVGGGARCDGDLLHGSPVTDLRQSLVATGFGYDPARRAHQAQALVHILPRVRDIRRFGAASLELCGAAQGRVDAYFEKGLGPWDHAAGALVATEAGLRVSGLRGRGPGPELVLAAPPGIYDALHDLLVEADADGGP